MICGETGMWRAVIAQAFIDASPTKAKPGSERKKDQSHARQWLLYGGSEFQKVCALAGVDDLAVRAQALHCKRNSWIRENPRLAA